MARRYRLALDLAGAFGPARAGRCRCCRPAMRVMELRVHTALLRSVGGTGPAAGRPRETRRRPRAGCHGPARPRRRCQPEPATPSGDFGGALFQPNLTSPVRPPFSSCALYAKSICLASSSTRSRRCRLAAAAGGLHRRDEHFLELDDQKVLLALRRPCDAVRVASAKCLPEAQPGTEPASPCRTGG